MSLSSEQFDAYREQQLFQFVSNRPRPKAFIKHVTGYGKIAIGFTLDIFKVPDLKMLNNGTIYLSDLERAGRNLNAHLVPVLQLEVIPGQG